MCVILGMFRHICAQSGGIGRQLKVAPPKHPNRRHEQPCN